MAKKRPVRVKGKVYRQLKRLGYSFSEIVAVSKMGTAQRKDIAALAAVAMSIRSKRERGTHHG